MRVILIDVKQSEHLSQHSFIEPITDKNNDEHYKLAAGVINIRSTEKFARKLQGTHVSFTASNNERCSRKSLSEINMYCHYIILPI